MFVVGQCGQAKSSVDKGDNHKDHYNDEDEDADMDICHQDKNQWVYTLQVCMVFKYFMLSESM